MCRYAYVQMGRCADMQMFRDEKPTLQLSNLATFQRGQALSAPPQKRQRGCNFTYSPSERAFIGSASLCNHQPVNYSAQVGAVAIYF